MADPGVTEAEALEHFGAQENVLHEQLLGLNED
jgi:hypothetical protein